MTRLTYLERRNGTYYARIDIPADLVAHTPPALLAAA
jgi:hypothetical protein